MQRTNAFGENEEARQRAYQDFVQRFRDDPESISDAEAARRYREWVAELEADDRDETHAQVFGQLSDRDRRVLAEQYQTAARDPGRPFQGFPQDSDLDHAAQPHELGRMMERAAVEDPTLLEQLTGPTSPLRSTGAKLAMAGAAALLAQRFLAKRETAAQESQGTPPENLVDRLKDLLNPPAGRSEAPEQRAGERSSAGAYRRQEAAEPVSDLDYGRMGATGTAVGALRGLITAAVEDGRAGKDGRDLLQKLDDAEDALADGKRDKAAEKLREVRQKVREKEREGKLERTFAQQILAALPDTPDDERDERGRGAKRG